MITYAQARRARAFGSMREWFDERSGQICWPIVEISGYGEMDEVEFKDTIEEITEGAEVINDYRNVEDVLNHVLFRRFKEKLERDEEISDKEAVEDRVVQIMSVLLAERKIR